MRKKRLMEEPENHDRWLVSYADFITLLFAFFVVMYSISSVNEGKYRVLSDSMVSAFSDPAQTLDALQLGQGQQEYNRNGNASNGERSLIDLFKIPLPSPPVLPQKKRVDNPVSKNDVEPDDEVDSNIQDLAESIEVSMSNLVDEGLIDVKRNKRWIEVEMKSSILFSSAEALLSPQSQPVLKKLAEILKPLNHAIHVEGFTDNVPISNFEFASNWELSAFRAASVVRYFIGQGIDKSRMAAAAYGENHPIDTNATPQGRARNRRVTLLVSRSDGVQRGLSALSGQRHRDINLDWGETKELEEELLLEGEPKVNAIRLDSGGVLFTDETPE